MQSNYASSEEVSTESFKFFFLYHIVNEFAMQEME